MSIFQYRPAKSDEYLSAAYRDPLYRHSVVFEPPTGERGKFRLVRDHASEIGRALVGDRGAVRPGLDADHLAGGGDPCVDLFLIVGGIELVFLVARVSVGTDHVVEPAGKGDAFTIEFERRTLELIVDQLDRVSGDYPPVLQGNQLSTLQIVINEEAGAREPSKRVTGDAAHIFRLSTVTSHELVLDRPGILVVGTGRHRPAGE